MIARRPPPGRTRSSSSPSPSPGTQHSSSGGSSSGSSSSSSSSSGGGGGNATSGSMAPSSSSHQNAAKKVKALLRRTHFPVARLRQLPVTPLGNGGGGGAGGGNNPWDGIVSGDPRAALVVLHWTLLDMSPLFASLLLDRDYAGLSSLTDFKFVATSLRMLREEFNLRPQLTVSERERERERERRKCSPIYVVFCQAFGCEVLPRWFRKGTFFFWPRLGPFVVASAEFLRRGESRSLPRFLTRIRSLLFLTPPRAVHRLRHVASVVL